MEGLVMISVIKGISHMIKKQKPPIKIVEEMYGKEAPMQSSKAIVSYLNKKGYSSLSKLIEAK
jgi:hypothetical protein